MMATSKQMKFWCNILTCRVREFEGSPSEQDCPACGQTGIFVDPMMACPTCGR